MMTRAAEIAFALLIACAPAAGFAQPQAAKDYPSRPIRLVVPYAPGGPMDFIGHVLGQRIAPVIGQNLFVDNRTGAGGAIGTGVVAKSPPDGYTILLTSSSHATLPSLVKNLPYDPVKDFTPITLVAKSVGHMLAVHPSLPVKSVKEFVALARAQPGKLNYGSGGVGNTMQLAAESFSLAAGVKLTHIPYKGVGQAIVDLIAGRIELAFVSARSGLDHVRSGRLRVLAIAAPARWSELAQVPTMDEAGIRGYTYAAWYGLWFPAGVPAEYVARIRTEVGRALDDQGTRRTLTEQGLIPIASTPQEFARAILDELEVNRRLVARIGLTPQ